MTALFVPPTQPLVDPQTGLCDRVWYRFFQRLFVTVGDGVITEEMAFSIAPMASDGYFTAQLSQMGGDLSPVAPGNLPFPDDLTPPPQYIAASYDDVTPQSQTLYFSADDVMPVLTGLQDQIASLRREIDDLRKGTLL